MTLEADELRARLAESAVSVGEFSHLRELVVGRGDALGPAFAPVGQNGAGVEFAPGAAAVGLSAAASKRVEGAREERVATEELLKEGRDLLLKLLELEAEGAEIVGHGLDSGACCLCIIILTNLQKSRPWRKKIRRR